MGTSILTRLALGSMSLLVCVFPSLGLVGLPPRSQDGLDKIPDETLFADVSLRAYSGPEYLCLFEYSVGGRLVQHKRCERAQHGDPWLCWRGKESTTYFITDLTGFHGGNELVVSGVDPDGKAVLERWSYPPRKDGWYALCPPLPQSFPPGTALPPAIAELKVHGLGGWKEPAASWTLPSAERSPLLESHSGPFLALAADPQGRYLVYHDHELQALYLLSLDAPQPIPQLLASALTHPQLDQVGILQVMDFSDQGRKLLVRRNFKGCANGASEVYTVFSDPENDGTFVHTATLDGLQWKASPYSDWSLWNPYWHP